MFSLISLCFPLNLPTPVPGAFCSFYARRACFSRRWAWSGGVHEAPTAHSPLQKSRRSFFCPVFTFLPLPTRLLQLQPPGGLVNGKTLSLRHFPRPDSTGNS